MLIYIENSSVLHIGFNPGRWQRSDHQTWMLAWSCSATSSSRVSRKARAKKRPKLERTKEENFVEVLEFTWTESATRRGRQSS